MKDLLSVEVTEFKIPSEIDKLYSTSWSVICGKVLKKKEAKLDWGHKDIENYIATALEFRQSRDEPLSKLGVR